LAIDEALRPAGQPLRRPVPQPPSNRVTGAADSRAPDD
jgi:hypothetical protein